MSDKGFWNEIMSLFWSHGTTCANCPTGICQNYQVDIPENTPGEKHIVWVLSKYKLYYLVEMSREWYENTTSVYFIFFIEALKNKTSENKQNKLINFD